VLRGQRVYESVVFGQMLPTCPDEDAAIFHAFIHLNNPNFFYANSQSSVKMSMFNFTFINFPKQPMQPAVLKEVVDIKHILYMLLFV
jgi:hypothetical protein